MILVLTEKQLIILDRYSVPMNTYRNVDHS
jgi:hypothetical protein